jgi:hypothetical protein
MDAEPETLREITPIRAPRIDVAVTKGNPAAVGRASPVMKSQDREIKEFFRQRPSRAGHLPQLMLVGLRTCELGYQAFSPVRLSSSRTSNGQ